MIQDIKHASKITFFFFFKGISRQHRVCAQSVILHNTGSSVIVMITGKMGIRTSQHKCIRSGIRVRNEGDWEAGGIIPLLPNF